MAAHNFIVRILAVCTVIGVAFVAAPADAEPAQPAAEAKPLKLNSYMRKPVASSATRTVKKKDGEYAKVTAKRRAKSKSTTVAQPVVPAEISPDAAQAFAAYELARVRVVTPEETHSSLLLADAAANATTAVAAENVQIVSAEEVNEIDRKADTPYAVSLDALSRDLAGSREVVHEAMPKAENDTWLQRILMAFGNAVAGLTTLVRILIA